MRRMKRIAAWIFLVLALVLTGCATATGPHRIALDRFSNRYPGMTVENFSQEEVEGYVRYFATQRGYEIKFADSDDRSVQQELTGDDPSLLWIAEKSGAPAILLISSSPRLTVSFVQPQGAPYAKAVRDNTEVLYAILKDKFGEGTVHLEAPAPVPN
jgi:hypothetical protein